MYDLEVVIGMDITNIEFFAGISGATLLETSLMSDFVDSNLLEVSTDKA
jgi:hypothetical protein